MLTRENGESHENTLVEEAIFDVTLVKFLVVSKEAVQPARKLAMGVEPAARALAGPVCQPHTQSVARTRRWLRTDQTHTSA